MATTLSTNAFGYNLAKVTSPHYKETHMSNEYPFIQVSSIIQRSDLLYLVKEIRKDNNYPVKAISEYDKEDTFKFEDFKGIKALGEEVAVKLNYSSVLITLSDGTVLKTDYTGMKTLRADILKAVDDHLASQNRFAEMETRGANIQVEATILEEVKVELPELSGSISDKYTTIVGEMSDLTRSINETFSLGDTEEIAKLFIEAKNKISSLAGTPPGKVSTFISKYSSKIPGGKKLLASVSSTLSENSSVQKNINFLFGVINDKYEKLVSVGEKLQQAKGHMVAQVIELEKLSEESEEVTSQYLNQADIPIRILSLDTQIKSSIEKYKSRLLKIDSSITACQATIIALGRDLPSLKTDLTDEMAIGGLLHSVDGYQKMYSELASLVANVTESTSEKTYEVIDNLFKIQIEDTHMTEYLAATAKRTEKLGALVATKSEELFKKAHRDAKFIAAISSGQTIESARNSIKKISS